MLRRRSAALRSYRLILFATPSDYRRGDERPGDEPLARRAKDTDEPLARRAKDTDEPLARRAKDTDEPLARRAKDTDEPLARRAKDTEEPLAGKGCSPVSEIQEAIEQIKAAGRSKPQVGRDPVNQPLINNWLEALGA